MSRLIGNYNRFSVEFTSGKGVYLEDSNGNIFLDFLSGVAVNSLGHSHPKILKAITNAAKKPIHVSNFFQISQQEVLAKKISKITDGDYYGFFCNSGTEANEAAMKIVRKFSGKNFFLAFSGGFHGRTLGALSITYKQKIHKDFLPLLPEVKFLEFNNFNDLKKINSKFSAVFLELIQGESGAIAADKKWVKKLFEICKKNQILTVIDEIQTGIGRTGKFFAFQNFGVQPDVFTLAKALGNGFPIGAMFANKKITNSFSPGSHGSTFGGNPFCTSVANTVVDEISQEKFLKNVRDNANYFWGKLEKIYKNFPKKIQKIDGMGLLIGINFFEDKIAKKVFESLKNEFRILVNLTSEKIIRVLPPLISQKKHFDFFCNALSKIMKNVS